MTSATKCPCCNGTHPIITTNGITRQECSAVPDGYAYIDRKYPTGPRGALIPIGTNKTA